jgi:holin-like protein
VGILYQLIRCLAAHLLLHAAGEGGLASPGTLGAPTSATPLRRPLCRRCHAITTPMPTLCAIAALFLLQALGDAIVRMAGWPLPVSVLGMLMLLGGLLWYGRVPDAFERSAKALLPHMMLLFIPSVAGVMLHVERVAREWQPILIACVLGTVVTLVVTALTLKLLLRGAPAALGPAPASALEPAPAPAPAQLHAQPSAPVRAFASTSTDVAAGAGAAERAP